MSIENDLKTNKKLNLSKKSVINLMYTGNFVLNEINKTLKPFNITNQQYNVLRILRGQNKKAIMLSDIQERMINKSSNTTRLIDKLIEKKYVTRSINKINRRKINIAITNNGIDFLKEIDPLIDDLEESIVKNLKEEELLTLNEILQKTRH